MGGSSSKQKEEEYKQSWGEYWTKNIKNEAIYGFLQKIMIESNLYEKGNNVTVDDVLKKLDSRNELIRAMAVWALFCLSKSRFSLEKKKG